MDTKANMADKEISLPFDRISNSQTINKVVADEMKQRGLDIHKNECSDMVDDHSQQRRIYKFKSRKFFGPWSHRG